MKKYVLSWKEVEMLPEEEFLKKYYEIFDNVETEEKTNTKMFLEFDALKCKVNLMGIYGDIGEKWRWCRCSEDKVEEAQSFVKEYEEELKLYVFNWGVSTPEDQIMSAMGLHDTISVACDEGELVFFPYQNNLEAGTDLNKVLEKINKSEKIDINSIFNKMLANHQIKEKL